MVSQMKCHYLCATRCHQQQLAFLLVVYIIPGGESMSKLSYRRETVRLLRESVLAKKYNWKRIFCTERYRSVFNNCEVIGFLINRIR